MRDKELIEKRNKKIAQCYHDMDKKGLRYDRIIRTLSNTFFLSEFRIQMIIRDMVRNGTLIPSEDSEIRVSAALPQ